MGQLNQNIFVMPAVCLFDFNRWPENMTSGSLSIQIY